MEVRNLKFVENNDGIRVLLNDVKLFEWELEEGILHLRNGAIPRDFLLYSISNDIEFGTNRKFLLKDLDKVKKESYKIVEQYVKFFIFCDQPILWQNSFYAPDPFDFE